MRGRLSWIVLAACAPALGGCAYFQSPRTYPSGQPLTPEPAAAAPNPQPYYVYPGQPLPEDPVGVTLRPQRFVARIGREVVLVAGVYTGDGYLRTNERLEWSIAPGSAGQFVDVQQNGWVDLLLGDFNRPRKINNTFAIGSTSRENVRLDRGMPTPADDVCVLRGQGWVTITSALEGTSHVTVFAPGVIPWEHRLDKATIYWVDAQSGFPPPSINPAGSRHVLTTTVLRRATWLPVLVGWSVTRLSAGRPRVLRPTAPESPR